MKRSATSLCPVASEALSQRTVLDVGQLCNSTEFRNMAVELLMISLISVPEIRVSQCNSAPVRRDGHFVLYWMTAYRRACWNFALDRAVEWAEKLCKPLVVLEALRCDYRWASDRIHSFILDGIAENACQFEGTGVLYYPF